MDLKPLFEQGYTRCNLLALADVFIVSDHGIQKTLKHLGEVFYFDPVDIILPGQKHGFFGGACGCLSVPDASIPEKTVFFNGSLKHHRSGASLKAFLNRVGYSFIELHDGPLFDGGGMFFLNSDEY